MTFQQEKNKDFNGKEVKSRSIFFNFNTSYVLL